MRTGEALSLTVDSVDLVRGIITISESKYRKLRKIPIHRSSMRVLNMYAKYRDKHVYKKVSDFFFVNIHGKKLNRDEMYHSFKKGCTASGIGKGARFSPRVVDLRHYFAIKVLINCHRKGMNPESVIPILSMYLGHENPKHTYWYLSATEELMTLICKRVERKFGGII